MWLAFELIYLLNVLYFFIQLTPKKPQRNKKKYQTRNNGTNESVDNKQ